MLYLRCSGHAAIWREANQLRRQCSPENGGARLVRERERYAQRQGEGGFGGRSGSQDGDVASLRNVTGPFGQLEVVHRHEAQPHVWEFS